ncbi:MAG: nucleotide exchange factor GrpE [Gemmatimonadota bacterium]|jgi:molecular chaperone GrpE|nr:MAG: nucleotide exchange factor GrpE [Gemmatimonadota bacterium]
MTDEQRIEEVTDGEERRQDESDSGDDAVVGHDEVLVAEQEMAEREAREDGLIRDLEELQDRHLRLAAEFENYRKRTRRELTEMRRRSQADLVRGLLDVLDDLSRVAHAASDATVDSLLEGVGLVEQKMRKELGDEGLERIDAAGQPFDPNLHEALSVRPTDDPAKDDVVSAVLLDGYTFGQILVRPARVEVMKYAEPSTEPSSGTAGSPGD